MKNYTFAVPILVVEMTCNITKIASILQVIPSKTFDNFFRNETPMDLWGVDVSCNDKQKRVGEQIIDECILLVSSTLTCYLTL